LVVGFDAKGEGGEAFSAPTYAVRPGGILHGPFASRSGCSMFETRQRYPESSLVRSGRAELDPSSLAGKHYSTSCRPILPPTYLGRYTLAGHF
jgi:hypothetical protein